MGCHQSVPPPQSGGKQAPVRCESALTCRTGGSYLSSQGGKLCDSGLRVEKMLAREIPRFHSKYELGRVLGQGQMGTVFQCWRRETGVEYAVKVCEKRGPKATAALSGLRSEAIARDALDSSTRNVMRVVKTYETGAVSLQISERLESKLKCGTVGSGKMYYTKETVRTLVRGILEGVAAMHAKGLAHLDIKADNIMLRCGEASEVIMAGDVTLIDFGSCAWFTEGENDVYTAAGSPYFCAPEMLDAIQADNVGMQPFPVSERADIWSLGVVTHLLATGHHPFATPATRGLSDLQEKLMKPFAPLSHAPLDPELADFLSQCFAIQASKRPSAKKLLSHAYLTATVTPVQQPLVVHPTMLSMEEDCNTAASTLDATQRLCSAHSTPLCRPSSLVI